MDNNGILSYPFFGIFYILEATSPCYNPPFSKLAPLRRDSVWSWM